MPDIPAATHVALTVTEARWDQLGIALELFALPT